MKDRADEPVSGSAAGGSTSRSRGSTSGERLELLAKMAERDGVEVERIPIIRQRRDAAEFPLSFAQERLWFLQRLDPSSAAYNVALALPIQVEIDIDAMKLAVARLLERHEVLRTVFPDRDGRPVQVIRPAPETPLLLEDLSDRSETERAGALDEIRARMSADPFDLSSGPIFRATLVGLGEQQHVLIMVTHHIAIDGWSTGVLLRDLYSLYEAAHDGVAAPLPALPVQYVDFAVWQRARLQGRLLEEHLDFWAEQLSGAQPVGLSADHRRDRAAASEGNVAIVTLTCSERLRELSGQEGTTMFMTTFAGLVVLLSRLSSATDITVGTPVAGYRERPELAQLVGCFINMLVLRVNAAGEPTFRELLQRVRSVALAAYAHQQAPFETIVERLAPERTSGANPLFQVTFSMQQAQPVAPSGLEKRDLGQAVGVDTRTTRFDLEFNVLEREDDLVVAVTYDASLFEHESVERIAGQYGTIMERVAEFPDESITSVPIARETSMTTAELLSYLRSLDIKLRFDGDRMKVNAPPDVMTDGLKRELSERKEEIRRVLESAGGSGPAERIEVIARDRELPISRPQQRLWFLDRLGPGSAAYNIVAATRLQRVLDPAALSRAFDRLIERHESFRTTFPTVDGAPSVVLHPASSDMLEIIDLTGVPADERDDAIDAIVKERAVRPFDLANGPLFRASLVRVDANEFVILYAMHHIISDGWSLEVFGRELVQLYVAELSGEAPELPPLPVQYVDYAAWQEARLESGAFDAQFDFWKEQLRGPLPVLELPTDRPRPPVQTLSGARLPMKLPFELTEALRALSRKEGATLFITLLSAFKTLLFRYTGQPDLIVGTPTAGRGRAEVENIIGFFVNNLVLRTTVSEDMTFRELIGRVRKVLLNAHANQDVPFDELVEVLRPERDVSRPPLFQVMFNSPTTPADLPEESDEGVSSVNFQVGTSRFELTVEVYEHRRNTASSAAEPKTGMTMVFEYNTDLFDIETIVDLQKSFRCLLEAVVDQPDQQVARLPVVTGEDRKKIVEEWNRTTAEYPKGACVHELISRQAEEHAGDIAVQAGADSLSYGALEERSSDFAARLRDAGVARGMLVGVYLDRSIDMVIALLGIMKAGGAYVPLDPTYPAERLQFMLEDSGAAVVVTTSGLAGSVPETEARLMCIDAEPAGDRDEGRPVMAAGVAPGDLVYVIYTSGSTGKPKGVEITHGAVVNLLTSMAREPGLTATDRLVAVTTLSFDIAALELYLPLTVGGRLILAKRSVAMSATALADLLKSSEATVMQATPATWRMLIQDDWQGNPGLKALCGGEALPAELADELVGRVASLWNLYGPTETTIWSSLHRVEAGGRRPVSIGRPIANTQMFILDAEQQPVPVGVAGELFIGGDGLARGYLNRPALTAERFVPHPLAAEPEARLYRTGDSARYRRDGTIEFLGRLDTQVKLRGFRIELGEIESTLGLHPAVNQAAVIIREDVPGDQQLTAYVVAAKGDAVDGAGLQQFLKTRLPDYMVPATFVPMDTLPLTPNRKVNRKALPEPDSAARGARASYAAPATAIEKTIAGSWEEVLRLDRVGLRDNFFDLGGHSLLVVQVHSRLEQRLETPPTLIDLFQYPTVAELAQFVSGGAADASSVAQARESARRQLQA